MVQKYLCNFYFKASNKDEDGNIYYIIFMILKELNEIYNLYVAKTFLELSFRKNDVLRYLCNFDFKGSKKYQDGIIFEIFYMKLKDLDWIYKLNVATTF